jgi:hypothetical protein
MGDDEEARQRAAEAAQMCAEEEARRQDDYDHLEPSAQELAALAEFFRRLDAAFGPIGRDEIEALIGAVVILHYYERVALIEALLGVVTPATKRKKRKKKWLARRRRWAARRAWDALSPKGGRATVADESADASMVCQHGNIQGKCPKCAKH